MRTVLAVDVARMPATMKLRGVEAGRGVAAMLVVLAHAGTLLASPRDFGTLPLWGALHFGYAGVDFFFVLSGFIIAYVHATDIGRPNRLRHFASRRLVRIYPLYWAVFAAYLMLLAISPSREGTERDPLSLLTSIVLLPHPTHEPILGVAWTLEHEVLFYLLFATAIVSRTLGRWILAIWLTTIVIGTVTGWLATYPLGFVTDLYNLEFFVGIGIATLVRRHRPILPLTCLSAGVALFIATGLVDDWGPAMPVHSPFLRGSYAVAAGLAVYGLAAAESMGRPLKIPTWMTAIGAASYSLYLTHIIVLQILQQMLRPAAKAVPLDVAYLAVSAVTILVAVAVSRSIEIPLLAWCRTGVLRLSTG